MMTLMDIRQATGAAVRLADVSKRYPDVVAVDNVSLEIHRGEFMTLLGPSGSGKTTMLNMIAGFILPTAGRILVDDVEITTVPPHKRNIGMVFQNYALFPHMTAFDNIAFSLRQRKIPKKEIERRVEQALELVQLQGLGKRFSRELSGGQQQRVALARALVFSPRVLLMDEPMGALDKKLREHLQLEVKRIHEELGITFIHVTHDQEESLVMSDRITIVHNGRIQQVGTTEEAYEHPATLFVAEFIGDSNVFRGTIDRKGNRVVVHGEGLALGAPANGSTPAGANAALVIRPERLRLESLSEPQRPSDWNACEGTVTQVVYLGRTRRFEVELLGGKRVVISLEASAFSAGDQVRVAWKVDDGILLSDRAVNLPLADELALEQASAGSPAETL
jgi:putative spermidine/putrescine transport system ATP-binding protein